MRHPLKRHLLTGLGFLALFLGVQWFSGRGLATGTPPPIHARMPDGREYAGPQFGGRPAVIYFWASWCGICRAMQDTVSGLAKDVPMMTVALQSGNAAEVRRYLEAQGFSVPVVLDEDGAIGAAYGIRGVPAVFILGPDGNIRSAVVGYSSEIGLRVRLWLAGL
jgi:thiol-disulfide isomerase/thioredoxin